MINLPGLQNYYTWDSIQTLVNERNGQFFSTVNPPDPAAIPPSKWCKRIYVGPNSPFWTSDPAGDGEALASRVVALLRGLESPPQVWATGPAFAPGMVVIDELRVGSTTGSDSRSRLVRFAYRMATTYPDLAGRWGLYLGNGQSVDYANLNSNNFGFPFGAIDYALASGGHVFPEMYIFQSNSPSTDLTPYCQGGDAFVRACFRGRGTSGFGKVAVNRTHYLVSRKQAFWPSSVSRITPVFGVSDYWVNKTTGNFTRDRAAYMDRLLWLWRTTPDIAHLILESFGGAGSWVWGYDDQGTDTGRDFQFRLSFIDYCSYGLAGPASRWDYLSPPPSYC